MTESALYVEFASFTPATFGGLGIEATIFTVILLICFLLSMPLPTRRFYPRCTTTYVLVIFLTVNSAILAIHWSRFTFLATSVLSGEPC